MESKRKRLPPRPDGKKREHRFRPGTVTVRNIRKLQKSCDLLMQHAPFNRVAREVAQEFMDEVRFSADVLLALQSMAEDRLVRLMQTANRLAVHGKRETVYARDVLLARSLVVPDLAEGDVSFDAKFPDAALRKLARRAGIKRYGDDSGEAYSYFLYDLLYSYLHDMTVCATHHNVMTLNCKLLVEALAMRGLHPAVTPGRRKTKKAGAGSASRRSSTASSRANSVDDSSDEEAEAMATVSE
jgi:histone H3